ncbi:hypothetical protein WKI68_05815 [Streptomyces sp. MS1.HAVA.3]|uniref:Uncharacterized protein n=1 Tax=Streptomyces caledonius TaxID=3134107 RepID=A0ABU8TZR7_9ACTN
MTRSALVADTGIVSRIASSPPHRRIQTRLPRASWSTEKTVADRAVPGLPVDSSAYPSSGSSSAPSAVPATAPSANPLTCSSEGFRSEVIASWRSSIPAPVKAEPQSTGNSVPAGTARRIAARICSGAISSPSSHASITVSSTSATVSTRDASSRGSASARASARPWPVARLSGRAAGERRRRICSTTRSASAPPRSILLMNSTVGTFMRRSARQRMTVCGCTPSTEDSTSTAASSTCRDRSTSAMKSGCPACPGC